MHRLIFINSIGIENIQRHCFDLGDYLIERLDQLDVGLVGPRERAHRAPHIYVIALSTDHWLEYFTQSGIRVSPERDGIRVSFGMFNTTGDIDRFIGAISSPRRAGGLAGSQSSRIEAGLAPSSSRSAPCSKNGIRDADKRLRSVANHLKGAKGHAKCK